MKIPTNKAVTFAVLTLFALSGAAGHAATAPTVTNLPALVDQIGTPVRLAGDSGGNFYLTDPRAGGVLKFGNDGRFLTRFTALGTPQGISVTTSGDLVLSQGSMVSVLSGSGAERFRLGKGVGQFKMANGVALDANGYIYVVDSLDNCVQVFTGLGAPVALPGAAPGKPVNSFGSTGTGTGQFSQPTGIAFEPAGNQLAIVDTLNNRVQFFSTSGSFKKSIGTPGLGGLKFSSPQGVTFGNEASGTVMYVVDSFQSNVQAIDLASGVFLRVIGAYGRGSGKLMVPTDAVFDGFDSRNARLVVANGFGNLTMYGIEIPAAAPGAGSAGGPSLSINTLPLATNLSTLTLSGTVAANATVGVSVNTSALIGPVAPGVDWSAVVTGLTPGTNQFTVTATGADGKTTTASVSAFVLATTGNIPVTPLSVNALPSLTKTALQTLSGTVQAGSTVSVNGSAAAVAGGAWSFSATLAQGVNSFQIQAANPSFINATTSINITLNSVAPVINVSMLPNGSTTSSQLLSISGTVADSLPTVVVILVNGQPFPDLPVAGGAFSTAFFLATGSNTVEWWAVDAAGNQSPVGSATITFAPSAPIITIGIADGSSSDSASVELSGSASAGSTVLVNGLPAPLTGTAWRATVTLAAGPNTVLATATLGGVTSSVKASISFDPAAPPLAVTSPPLNALLPGSPGQSVSVTGVTGVGINLLATLDGASVPVSVGSNGSFSIALMNLGIGSHTVAITGQDALGNSSTTLRTVVVADPAPPLITFDTTNPLKLSVGRGVTLIVRDKNGPIAGAVGTVGGVSSLDLTGKVYDPASLNITAVTLSGGTSRNGVVVQSEILGQVSTPTILDAVEALKMATGSRQAGTGDLMHGDVAPLVNGVPVPDGKIDIGDVMVIMMRIVGIPW